MKASDTILNARQIEKLSAKTTNSSVAVEEQAEISFKAGIKEVVGKLKTYEGDITLDELFGLDNFNEQLKEWGIK